VKVIALTCHYLHITEFHFHKTDEVTKIYTVSPIIFLSLPNIQLFSTLFHRHNLRKNMQSHTPEMRP